MKRDIKAILVLTMALVVCLFAIHVLQSFQPKLTPDAPPDINSTPGFEDKEQDSAVRTMPEPDEMNDIIRFFHRKVKL